MEEQLKQRLVGTAVLVSLAIIFLPMILKGPEDLPAIDGTNAKQPREAKASSVAQWRTEARRPDALTRATSDIWPLSQPDDRSGGQAVQSGDVVISRTVPNPVTKNEAGQGGPPATSFTSRLLSTRELTLAPVPAAAPPAPGTIDKPPAGGVPVKGAGSRPARLDAVQTKARTEPIANKTSTVAKLPATKPLQSASSSALNPARATKSSQPASSGRADQGPWLVQLASFSNRANAEVLVSRLKAQRFDAFLRNLQIEGRPVYRVLVGPVDKRNDADDLQKRLSEKTRLKPIVIAED